MTRSDRSRDPGPRALAALALGLAAAACAGAPKQEAAERALPEWYLAKQDELRRADYPKLASVPEPPKAGQRPPAAWIAIEEELRKEAEAVLNDPRNAPADVRDLPDFEAAARAETGRASPAPR
jgi:hypothetical protein